MKYFKVTLFILSLSIFLFHVFKLVYLWTDIPERIAIHFTNDIPDNWGPKSILYIMPVIGVFLWFLIGILVKKPDKLNYINLTEANKEIQFSRTGKVLILIQNLSFLSFLLANEALLNYAVGIDSSLPFIISLSLLAFCFIAPIYLLIWASTLRR
ncbi:DUF1648 domain-containing protein [Paenibacillus sp. 2TAF8]|uniref:DUF1648 domain-containing protein n=1 Tax=Paenibacillus sp. 2TAF8 TaxID=3233020 RepID=UPI003F95EEEA